MRNIRKGIALLVLVIFWKLSALAQSFTVASNLTASEILIGDEVSLQVLISHDPGIKIESINYDALSGMEKVELKDTLQRVAEANENVVNVSQIALLTSFDAGTYNLPPIEIKYSSNGQVKSERTKTLRLEVKPISVTVTDTTDVMPIKDILKERVGLEEALPFLIAALVLLLLGIFVFWLIRRNRAAALVETQRPLIQKSAYEIAIEKLHNLEYSSLLKGGKYKLFQSELTYILREYLEGRYDIAALESTTTEILNDLSKVGFPEEWGGRLKTMLQKADLVKFAKASFPLNFHQEALAMVKNFVLETRKAVEVDQESEEEEKEHSTTEIE